MEKRELFRDHPENKVNPNKIAQQIVEDFIRCVYILRNWYGISKSQAIFKMQNDAWQIKHSITKTKLGRPQNTYILSHDVDGTYLIIQDNAEHQHTEFSYLVSALIGGRHGYYNEWILFTPSPLELMAPIIIPIIDSLVEDTARHSFSVQTYLQRFLTLLTRSRSSSSARQRHLLDTNKN